ncbi:MAG TPA: hypothetical protein VH105_26755 [Burkholderiales bacterium]|jgi:hypothetical protein|nr:hypothetical protein [Burkholderiales bacterium]
MKTKLLLSCLIFMALAACGNKTPESQAAKDVGNIPKQTIDKATNDLNANLQKGADRDKKEDQK